MNEVVVTRIKLFVIFFISNVLLFYKEAVYLNIAVFLLISLYIGYKQKFKLFFNWLRSLFIASIIIFGVQMLTGTGIILSLLSSVRILSLSSLIFLLVYTTRLSLIVKSLSFLPINIAYILSLSFGMIPQLSSEIKQIIIAQQARGHKINWNIFKSYLPILLPLFTKSFVRSEQISISMQARGFEFSKK
jgi:energy-coupling factor transporter transmembrane protein EcfT